LFSNVLDAPELPAARLDDTPERGPEMKIRSLLLIVILAAIPALPARAAKPAESTRATNAVPNLELPTRDGKVVADSLRGKVVLVDFWASWCTPCKQSFPWLHEMHDRYAAKGLRIIAINLDKERDKSDAFLEAAPVPFTIAYDPFGRTAEAFHVKAMPTSFVINRAGELVYTHAGFERKDAAAFEERIRTECAK
jgi:cytochrome c biogenesis protein CcmG, thiol:disulfide interchange protein DsbE